MRILLMIISLLSIVSSLCAQDEKAMRDALREGNRYYAQGNYDKAEASYLKAYEIDSLNTNVLYNLGTTYLVKRDLQQANEKLLKASQTDTSRNKLKGTRVFHNLGVDLQCNQDYKRAIVAYKQALRYNPYDEETRYNLALCQKLLKEDKQDEQKQNEQNQDDKKQEQEQQQQQQQQDKKDEQQQQQQQQQQQDQMSKENAQQMLEAVKQDERNVQRRMQEQQQSSTRRKKEKDW